MKHNRNVGKVDGNWLTEIGKFGCKLQRCRKSRSVSGKVTFQLSSFQSESDKTDTLFPEAALAN